jgi:mxaK protein
MASRINISNSVLILILMVSLAGIGYSAYKHQKIQHINKTLRTGQVLKSETYPLHAKFSSAFFQGSKDDYKHAVQTYGQALDIESKSRKPDIALQARIHYNIATNLFLYGLSRDLNDDGSLKDESKYSFNQAKAAYEQSLRLYSENSRAKFNLSLLNSVTPINMTNAPKDQTGVELSNTPIGLP